MGWETVGVLPSLSSFKNKKVTLKKHSFNCLFSFNISVNKYFDCISIVSKCVKKYEAFYLTSSSKASRQDCIKNQTKKDFIICHMTLY